MNSNPTTRWPQLREIVVHLVVLGLVTVAIIWGVFASPPPPNVIFTAPICNLARAPVDRSGRWWGIQTVLVCQFGFEYNILADYSDITLPSFDDDAFDTQPGVKF